MSVCAACWESHPLKFQLLLPGEWNLHELESIKDRVGTVVVTMGTTGAGRVEPLHELLPLFREMGLRVHLDAAYGGYFKLLEGTGGY